MITLRLGDFVFARGELPESIAFGAAQQLHVHKLVGGARVIDTMGAAPVRPEWSGWLAGPQALARARYLQRLAEAGEPLALRFGEFAYTVVVARFSAELRAGPSLPYTIALEVVTDLGAGRTGSGRAGLTQMIAQDLTAAVANATAIGDSGLIAAIGVVSAALTANGSAELTPAAIRPLLPSIAAAQAQTARLEGEGSAQIAAVAALSAGAGGNATGPGPLDQFRTGLATASRAASQARLLNATTHALGRMTTNLALAGGAAGATGAMLTTGSTDLYHLAATAYGDARAWTRIAEANGLTDPAVVGIAQLVIPPAGATAATGVLNV